MKTIFLVVTLLVLATSSPVLEQQSYFLVEDAPGIFRKEPLIGEPQYVAADSDVKIFFYSKKTSNGVQVDLKDANSLKKTDFSNAKETLVISHGWQNSYTSDVNVNIRQAYLSVKDINVFVVDWSKLAKLDYITAQANVESVGKTVGNLINNAVSHSGLNLGKTILTGHSLGAHVVGVAGRTIGGKADHVVGLDPAGPLFNINNKGNRIDTSSGKFVEIIHSNAGKLGFNHQLGHADYWPNGGQLQAGCGVDVTGSCSHSRSYQYFAESVKTGKFVARSCTDWNTYKSGGCNNHKSSLMGQDNIDKSARGGYFLATNDHSPFAKG